MSETSLIIHGHFYQPPRENPWTGEIERQGSAAPYHDWNERITAECYRPNSRSRVLDPEGRVLDVVNNYEFISFNFGPTLCSYLQEHDPETWARIVDADRRSIERRGHGNAMAQGYNHMILPLASERDRWTQIRWGLDDFRTRFGRQAEGLWLPETAVDAPTLDALARAGMRFVLLAPSQIEAVRPIGAPGWQDVSEHGAPSHRAYQLQTAHGPMALLVYDAALSRAVAFEHLLRSAGGLADRIQSAAASYAAEPDETRLVFVCTDGESYGHHEPMGDMCLAYLATRELAARGIALSNPAAFLDAHPPRWEARIKPGEGTAWSCAHGLGRWARDCGCSTGGPAGWNQAWRAPLRAAFDALRARIDPLFERLARRHLVDPWLARDDYVSVLLERPLGAVGRFFDTHAAGELDDEARAEVFRLMEMQRNAMLMYASCAWFFTDLSGIETVQALRYYARAVQLAELLGGAAVDEQARSELARARSNIASMGNGLDLVRRFVRPSMLDAAKVAAHQALLALVEPRSVREQLYRYRILLHDTHRDERGAWSAYGCRATVEAGRTREGGVFEVLCAAGGELQLRAFVRAYRPDSRGSLDATALLDSVERLGFEAACAEHAARFEQSLGLTDMLHALRERVVTTLLRPVTEELDETFDALYARHDGLLPILADFGLALLPALLVPIGYAGSRRFESLVERELDSGDLSQAAELGQLLESLGVPLERRRVSRMLTRKLGSMLADALDAPDASGIDAFVGLLEQARGLKLDIDEAGMQDQVASEIESSLQRLLEPAASPARTALARALVDMAGYLNLNTHALEKRLDSQASAERGDGA